MDLIKNDREIGNLFKKKNDSNYRENEPIIKTPMKHK